MGGENKFFFEEDTTTQSGTGLDAKEQADIFGEIVSESGIVSDLDSMAPMGVEPVRNEMHVRETPMTTIEYGVIGDDVVVHITPTHPQRNLKNTKKLNSAIKSAILNMNEIVPFDLKVEIHLPKEDWDVKVLSFLIKGGANAWNLDLEKFNTVTIPKIEQEINDICVKL